MLADDDSRDATLAVAGRLGIRHIVEHDRNRGYGGNQKTCYRTALSLGADIVVMLHPDVLGSRILGTRARRGGMPLYKYASNRALTAFENVVIGQKLSEYHTGFRAYTRRVLDTLPFEHDSDDFVFDNEILVQAHFWDFRIAELTCPTRYFPEASSIGFARSLKYGALCCATAAKFRLQRLGLADFRLFSPARSSLD